MPADDQDAAADHQAGDHAAAAARSRRAPLADLRQHLRQRGAPARRACRRCATTWVARAAFSSWLSWRRARPSSSAVPRAPARSARLRSAATMQIVSVEDPVHLGLEQQWHLDHGCGGVSGQAVAPARDPFGDQRVQGSLEPVELLGTLEDDRSRPVPGRCSPSLATSSPQRSTSISRPARRRAGRGRPRQRRASRRRAGRAPRAPRTCRRRSHRSGR